MSKDFKYFTFLLFVLSVLVFSARPAIAESYVVTVQDKQEEKYKNRWTLADWFETKRKFRLQDMWLAGVTNRSPYEFLLGYRTSYMENDADGSTYRFNQALLGANVHMVGLEGHYVTNDSDGDGWNALFNLRPIGDAAQNTNITLSYGIRQREDNGERFNNQFYQGALTLYLMKAFGVKGVYRGFITGKSSRDNRLSGSDVELEAFIDFAILRVHGGYIIQKRILKNSLGSELSNFKGDGYSGGVTLFF
ncbi:hypothetical protein GW915_12385 [bacterium]|nr:hypothetical protein [bacterium]